MTEQLATLCYVVRDGQLLLIRKKRGIGAGKINGPGGKVDPGETPLEAAIRETREEVGVIPNDPQPRGDLLFTFADGLVLRCLIYLADGCRGEPHETPEALPLWFPLDALPYGEMWEDDQEWLPLLLAGESFTGSFGVDGDRVTKQVFAVSNTR